MNDRYLFRAWDKERENWQYFTLLQLAQGEASRIWTKLEKWQQCTGLEDKNGELIFEGDIGEEKDGKLFVIEWSDSLAGFVPHLLHAMIKHSEIIGNKFDNPELLEGVKR